MADGTASDKDAPVIVKQHERMTGLTFGELSTKWKDVVKALEAHGVKVVNPDHTLEGALSIR